MGSWTPREIVLNEDEQRIYERLGPLFEEERLRLARALATGPLFGRKEFELRDQVHDLGAKALEVAADERQKKGGYEGASLVCPQCSRDARFVERRGKYCTSLLGPIRLTRYYHCRSCGRGHVPWDHELGLGVATLTPAASEVASIAGVQTSVAQGAEVTLHKLCGLRVSESTVERVTEAASARLRGLQQNKVTFGDQRAWVWQRDARGRSCAYVGLDATGVRQQGAGGVKAEGRMACVGSIYHPRSAHDARRPEPHEVRYLAALWPDDEALRRMTVHAWYHRLKHEGGKVLIEALEAWDLASATARQQHPLALRYFRNNVHRMDYPRYVANGWQIGSGPVESACKTVVANRLKGSGMRWGEDGSDAVCHLRALYLSQPGQWESFWKTYPN